MSHVKIDTNQNEYKNPEMFRIAGQLHKAKLLIQLRQQIKLPLVYASKYPRKEYSPLEREPCPPELPLPPKPKNDAAFWGVMTVVVLVAGFAVYAKHTPEIRDWLVLQAPWFDDLVAVLYQENMTYGEFALKSFGDLKELFNSVAREDKPKTCSYEGENTIPIVASQETAAISSADSLSEDGTCVVEPPPVLTKNICEVVECVSQFGECVMANYSTAAATCAKYNKFVEDSMKDFDISLLKELHRREAERKLLVEKCIESAEEANASLMELNRYIECGIAADKEDIEQTKLLVQDYDQRIKTEYIKYQWENDRTIALDELWHKVDCSLSQYMEDIETMFPEVKYIQNKVQLVGDMDLLLHYTSQYTKRLERNLNEAITGMTERVDRGIETLPQGEAAKKKRDAIIQSSIQQKRAELDKEFATKYDNLKRKNDKILEDSLKAQLDRHQQALERKLPEIEKLAEEKLNKMVKEKVDYEKNLMQHQLGEMAVKVSLLEANLYEHLKAESEAKRSKELWAAGAALLSATRRGENLVKVNKELRAIEKAGGETGDQLVTTVLKAIPDSVREQGVMPESVLRARYNRMETAALRVALVEQDGGPLPIYLLSWIQSALLFMKVSGIPQEEVDNPPKEPFDDLDTFDLLQRARFWLERGNLATALRYVSALEGASRLVAATWYDAAHAHLETKQAAEAVLAHAAAMGLQYM